MVQPSGKVVRNKRQSGTVRPCSVSRTTVIYDLLGGLFGVEKQDWMKYLENGEYLRAAEVSEEQNQFLVRNLFKLFADILQIIEVNLTERCFMSIMIP